jgi:hypothetical protein
MERMRGTAAKGHSRSQEDDMTNSEVTVAVFKSHAAAEDAINKLNKGGFAIQQLSIVGKGYHTEEQVKGFYTAGDRITFWGSRGAFWGGLWGLFFGGVYLTLPIIGPVFVLGTLVSSVVAAIEGAVVTGGLTALGAALYSIGVPKNSIVDYETAVRADGFLVMAHGTAAEVERAKSILGQSDRGELDASSNWVPQPVTAALLSSRSLG